jgi:hypothetical protein
VRSEVSVAPWLARYVGHDGDPFSGDATVAQRRRAGPSSTTTQPSRAASDGASTGPDTFDDHLGIARQLVERALDHDVAAVQDDQAVGQSLGLGRARGW